MKYTTDNKQRFETIVVPEYYTLALLRLAHDDKYGFGVVCRMYQLYSTNLLCLACEGFICLFGWNPYL